MSTKRRSSGSDGEYETAEARIVDKWSEKKVLAITPMSEGVARRWLGAANMYGSRRVVTHFAEQVSELSSNTNS